VTNPLRDLQIGDITELKATHDYFGVYFVAIDAMTGDPVCECHLSLMHSHLSKRLDTSQIRRALTRCRSTMIGLDVVMRGEMILERNIDGSLHRALRYLVGLSDLTTRLWEVRTMICNWLGPRYGEHRDDFHISFDRVVT